MWGQLACIERSEQREAVEKSKDYAFSTVSPRTPTAVHEVAETVNVVAVKLC